MANTVSGASAPEMYDELSQKYVSLRFYFPSESGENSTAETQTFLIMKVQIIRIECPIFGLLAALQHVS
jgi:hypothetical protein